MTSIRLLLAFIVALVSTTSYAQTSTKGISYVTQAANPCPAGTSCMWVDTANKQVQFFDGTTAKTMPSIVTSLKGDLAVFNGTIWQKLAIGANGTVFTADNTTATGAKWAAVAADTLATVYAAGSAAADQTMLVAAADGGPVIAKANAAATGTLFQTQTNGGAALVSFTDNSTNTLTSAMADGAAAIAVSVDTTTAWSNATARLLKLATNLVEKLYVLASGELIASSARAVGTTQAGGVTVANTTAAINGAQQYSPMLITEGRGFETSGNTSGAVKWGIQTRPVQSTAFGGDLVLWQALAAGAYAERFSFADDAVLSYLTANRSLVIFQNNVGDGFYAAAGALVGRIGNVGYTRTTTAAFDPETAYGLTNGTGTHPWSEVYVRHVVSKSTAAPTCVVGAALGTTGQSCSPVTGTDTAFLIPFVTGIAGAGAGILGTITFNTAWGAAPKCMVQGKTGAIQNDIGHTTVSTNSAATTTTISINTGAAPANGNIDYGMIVTCIQ